MFYRKSTIPLQAKLVFKGQIFDVYQWEQKMYDVSIAIFEKLKRPDTVQVIAVTDDKKIIVQEEEQPSSDCFFGLPGGRVDEQEDPLNAAKRELLEETGYEAKEMELIRETRPYGKIDWVIYHFVARGCKKVAEPRLDVGEKIKTMLVTFEDFVKLAESHKNRDLDLLNYLNHLRLHPSEFQDFQKALGL